MNWPPDKTSLSPRCLWAWIRKGRHLKLSLSQLFFRKEPIGPLNKYMLYHLLLNLNVLNVYDGRFSDFKTIKCTLSRDFSPFFSVKDSIWPPWTGENGFENFFVFAKIFAKNVCPHSHQLCWQGVSVVNVYTPIQCQHGRWLCCYDARIVNSYTDNMLA